MRPPVRWMSNAPKSICPAAMLCRVSAADGRARARKAGNAVIAPPRSTAAQTCKWTWLTDPVQVRGAITSAAMIPPSHSQASNPANNRSVCRRLLCHCSSQMAVARSATTADSLMACLRLGWPLRLSPWRRIEKRATEHRTFNELVGICEYDVVDRLSAEIGALMSPREGNAATKPQVSVAVIEKHLTRGSHPEALRMKAGWITGDGDSRDCRSRVPKVCFGPPCGGLGRFEEEHLRDNAIGALRHHHGQLPNSGPGTRATRMCKYQQIENIRFSAKGAVAGPVRLGRCRDSGGELVE